MTETSLQLPRACSHCERPAVVHVCVPGDGHSRFLCPDHVISTERAINGRPILLGSAAGYVTGVEIDEATVAYPEACPMGLGCPDLDEVAHAAATTHPRVARGEDDEMASWEPCQGVAYPDGYFSGPYPCDGLAEPGEELCLHCRSRR